MYSRRPSGFTLIELMIVLAIIAIAASLAFAAASGSRPRTRLVAATSEIRVQLLKARTQAMKTRKYSKLCFWNDATPFDATSAGLMLSLECRAVGSSGCVQERDVCQGTAGAPTFKANTVDATSNVCDSDFWCVTGGVSYGATTTTTIAGVSIEGKGSDQVSINRFWTGSPLAAGAQGTAAILETTFDSAARVNELRSTTSALNAAIELTNNDQCLNSASVPVAAGGSCVNFQNRIRASYTFGGAVRIQE
jgi:prepilin-type N-terminal cleavage/methylation domain-containing protein